MYLVTVMLIRAMQLKQQGETLSKLLEGLREPVESTEIRLKVQAEDFTSVARQLIEHVLEYASEHEDWHIAPDNREGVRISFDVDGELNSAWFLLRLSVHDPVMPLNAESDVPGGVKVVLTKLYEALRDQEGVDLEPLEAAL
jgi:phosphomannomutase